MPEDSEEKLAWPVLPENRASYTFLRNHASRHFLFLTYFVRQGVESERVWASISCFVVEIDGGWLLVTAGHVIDGIRLARDRGYIFEDWCLHDEMAGHQYPFGVPTPFDVDDWAVAHLDSEGFDYAVATLEPIIVANLRAGGVQAIGQEGWDAIEPEACRDWLLVGVPAETQRLLPDGRHLLKVTLIPLYKTAAPPNAVLGSAKLYGLLRAPGGQGEPTIEDIGGMSGGPVFGTYVVDERLRFCAIGIQSSWYPQARVAAFCPLAPFLGHLQTLIREKLPEMPTGNRLDV